MTPDILKAVREHGVAQYPNEACGLIVARGKKAEVVLCENVSEKPREFFTIARVEYTRIADSGEVLGVWHTHPGRNSSPSDADRQFCEVTGLPWLIQGLTKTADGAFDFALPEVFGPSGFVMPYIERPYVPGVFDCYSLIVDYLSREFDVHVNRQPYTLENGTPGYLMMTELWEEEGYVRLINEEPRKGDVFFMELLSAYAGKPNHCAVYIGDDQILHHCHGRLSKVDQYGGTWRKHTTYHLRHRQLCN